MGWVRDRSLTIVMMGLFGAFACGQILTGWTEYNHARLEHARPAIPLSSYFRSGHLWEALFENWESEFLQMAAFVTLTTVLYQRGSPESRRPGVIELVDADPRRFAHRDDVPWPVKRGGWMLKIYEHSLGLALFGLFAASWTGHLLGGWADYAMGESSHCGTRPGLLECVSSSRFWFESLQNWQSEFLSIGAMVWLGVYLRQRGSPESKPVHAPHSDTGR